MYRAIAFIILIFSTGLIKGQVPPPLAFEEFKEGLNPVDEIPLFNLAEIKKRGIDTAFIIYHPASWAEYHPTINPCNCSYSDTLSMYRFDLEGRIIEHTIFHQSGDYSTTHHFDTLGNRIAVSLYRRVGAHKGTTTRTYPKPDSTTFNQVFIRKKQDKDSIITTIYFLKFQHGLDTATIQTKRLNAQGKLLEVQSIVNKKNARELDDDTGESTYHYKYDYDSQGRLIYYRDYESNEYKRISYPFYGRLTEVYNAATNQLKEKHIKLIKEEKGVITVIFDRKQITLTPLEKGSALFKLQTIVEPGEIPLLFYHEIVYKKR
jgi:hypothetical protein